MVSGKAGFPIDINTQSMLKSLSDEESFSRKKCRVHAIEKLLKALYVVKNKEQDPYIHNLLRLAESCKIPLTEERKEQLLRITTFNLEARYPDEKRSFRNKCTEEFTAGELANIEEVFKWLEPMLQ